MHIFRMPASTPKLTAEALSAYTGGQHYTRIGTTVTITRIPAGDGFTFSLYGLPLACIYPKGVSFTTAADDPHNATGEWLDKIAQDNGLGSIYRDKWVRYLWGPYSEASQRTRTPIRGQTFEIRSDAHA